MTALSDWTAREAPRREPIDGRYVRLEPLDPVRHAEGLHAASGRGVPDDRFRWLFETPPQSLAETSAWAEKVAAGPDPLFFTVIDRASGEIAGRQAFMRIDRAFGVIEIGNILWNDPVARRPAATEALFLFARHAFDDLGYRRFEWKCNALNLPSRRAAERFGFTYEGTFRSHMVVKGRNRDTAWYAMIDDDWPALRAAFEEWLSPHNFDSEGRQRRRLEELRRAP